MGLCPETAQPENNACPWTESAEPSRVISPTRETYARVHHSGVFTADPSLEVSGAQGSKNRHSVSCRPGLGTLINCVCFNQAGLTQPGPSCPLISRVLPAVSAFPELQHLLRKAVHRVVSS